MSVYIHEMATAAPEKAYSQGTIQESMKTYGNYSTRSLRLIDRIYSRSGISQRHSVIPDLSADSSTHQFFHPQQGALVPSTGQRNKLYKHHARTLYRQAAEKTLRQSEKFNPEDITHVITVSCTGFYAPGPDFHLVRDLGLKPNTQRFHIGFMGCFAAFPALKMANSFAQQDPNAVVLVVTLELCSLHLQFKEDMDTLISNSVFADGAAAALISKQLPHNERPSLQLNGFASNITDEGEEDMAWEIGDTGFDMVLSTYVPKIIDSNMSQTVYPLLEKYGLTPEDIQKWAIHPGGRSILDKVESSLALKKEQISDSRHILDQYGNMSSATILFVLQNILYNSTENDMGLNNRERIFAMAFGPGLTIESSIMTYNPAEIHKTSSLQDTDAVAT